MSLVHQALDRPPLTSDRGRSGFNPLQRQAPVSSTRWWIITAVALLATVLLAWSVLRPGTAPTPNEQQPLHLAGTTEIDAGDLLTEVNKARQVSEFQAPVAPPPLADTTETAEPTPQPAVQSSMPDTVANTDAAPSPQPQAAPPTPITADTPAVTSDRGSLALAKEPAAAPARAPTEALPGPADSLSANTPSAPASTETASRPVSSVARAATLHEDTRRAIQAAISQGNLAVAEQRLRSWIDREPALDEPRVWLAKIHLNRGAAQEAESLLVGLQSIEALGLRGLLLERTGRYADAARVFESLTRDDTGNSQWWLHWAINLENSGRLAEARMLYQTYLQQFSGHNARLTTFATERFQALAGL